MTPPGPRVLHLDPSVEWRGGQQQLAYLLAGRPGDGWAGVPDSPLARRIGPPRVALHPTNDPRNVWILARAWRKLRDEYTIAAAHTPHAHGVALLARVPVVVHRRVDFAPRSAWKYRYASGVVAVSRAVRDVMIDHGMPAPLVRIVHDGVPPAAAPGPLPPEVEALPRPLYVAVGALVGHKGHVHAVEAMVDTPGSLVIAGEGELRPALEARIALLGLADRVRLLGSVADVSGLLHSADAFVHPSVEEGMGQVVVEAMAAGARVVATTAGGLPEVVGTYGELVPPGQPDALGDALRRVLGRPKGEGIERAARFTVERMVSETSFAYAAFAGVTAPTVRGAAP